MKLALSFGLILTAVMSTTSHAAPLDDARNQIAQVCRPDIQPGCASVACGLVSSSVEWPEADQTALGDNIAALVAELGQSNPSVADEIQGCVALGPSALVSGFQATTASTVADTGGGVAASAQ